ncbi:MAG: M1 family aminopeptidase [Candidatus Hinthialibacter antarcticus]|nr:M1 family aminopeptidase [Candidatus Hinthialibacter antarcticus]
MMKHISMFSVFVTICLAFSFPSMAEEDFTCAHGLFPPKLVDGEYPRHYRQDRTVDFERMILDVTIEMDDKAVKGNVVYFFRPIHDEVTAMRFDAVDMEIQSVSFDGLEFDWQYLDNQIYIEFPKALPMGRQLSISIGYRAWPQEGMYFSAPDSIPPKHPDQLYTLNEPFGAAMWFPNFDYPNDRIQTELIATVPKKFVTLSNGLLVGSKEQGGWRTDHWKQETPHTTYLVSLVVGDFDIVRDEDWRGIPVEYYVEAGRADDAIPSLSKTPAMLEFFSNWLDFPYPYEKYAQSMVRYFNAGGMEHTTATTMFEWLTIDEEARLDVEYDDLISHEMIHQWFGDWLTCEKWDHLWLNESFATYLECLWRRHESGQDYYLVKILDDMNGYIGASRSYQRAIVTNKYPNPREMFDAHSYPKGGFVLSMLHRQLGEELFRKTLKTYLETGPGLVDTDDLMEAVEKVTGRPMDRFFEQWVYSPGHPKVKVTHEWMPERKQVKVRVQQTQEMEEGRLAFTFPLDVEIVTDDGSFVKTVEITKKDESVFVDCDKAPQSVVIDPQLMVLMELEHKKSTDMLLRDLKDGSSVIVKIRAIDALKDETADRIVDALAAAVKDENNFRRVRENAVGALGSIKTDAAREALLEFIAVDDPHVRRNVVTTLGGFYKNEQVADALIGVFKNDASVRVVAAAARSLSRIKAEKAVPVLRSKLDRESFREYIRRAVIGALVDFKDKKLYATLYKYANDPYHRDLRIHAMTNLGTWARELESHEEDALDFLVKQLQSTSHRIQGAAITGLQNLRHEDAVPYLQEYADAGPTVGGRNEGLRERARNAIKTIRKDQSSDLSAKNAERLDTVGDEQKDFEKRINELEETVKQLSETSDDEDK